MPQLSRRRFHALALGAVASGTVNGLLSTGCSARRRQPNSSIVAYVSLDAEFSQPILQEFSRQTGIKVRAKYDIESTKTVGLTQALIAESRHPRCDLFWNNEILNTIRLENLGLLERYESPQALHYPAAFRSAAQQWCGFAARARVFLINTDLVASDSRPASMHDLLEPRWRGKIGIAKPLFGTTASHVACLFAYWGEERARQYFLDLKANQVQILSGNKQVALAVARGEVAVGLTDTDDAIIEVERGAPVAMVYPDREATQMGTLFIPNSLALIRGGPNPAAARKLVDYLLTVDVEEQLAQSASAQIPLHDESTYQGRVETPRTVKLLEVDFAAAARQWDTAARFIRDQFTISTGIGG
ncbi:MAG: extracellular solute-binding protein [Planctomycetota bacterium]